MPTENQPPSAEAGLTAEEIANLEDLMPVGVSAEVAHRLLATLRTQAATIRELEAARAKMRDAAESLDRYARTLEAERDTLSARLEEAEGAERLVKQLGDALDAVDHAETTEQQLAAERQWEAAYEAVRALRQPKKEA